MSDFKLITESSFAHIHLDGKELEHEPTGMRVLFLKNADPNKTFAITLLTPPEDSKGTPHILEHSVLCGSKKYPLKDPFAALLKSSLHTYLNAFTAHSYTSYPAASCNTTDFFNLFTVYWDAVFAPLLTEETFARQAWHYRIDDVLVRQGVVYNEMKGRYADADSTLYRGILKGLYAGSHYVHDSGGDPLEIPELTYASLKEFHARCYHPSNARVMVYGDFDEAAVLAFLQQQLQGVKKLERLVEERAAFAIHESTITIPYQPTGETKKPWIVTKNWPIIFDGSIKHELQWTVLEEILYGSQASPIYVALMNSGLGDRVAGFGLVDTNHDAFFSLGLRGVAEADQSKVLTCIDEALNKIVVEGVPERFIEATINSLSFRLREQVFNSPSRGISLLSYVTSSWMFRGNPYRALDLLSEIETMRSELTPAVLKKMVEGMLKGPSVVVILAPDQQLFADAEKEEARVLQEQEATLSLEQKKEIARVAGLVDDTTPDDEDALRKIPTLALSDLRKSVTTYPLTVEALPEEGGELLVETEETHGVTYIQLGFDARGLTEKQLLWLPLFLRLLTGTGTAKRDIVTLTQDIQRLTGGIGTSRMVSLHHVTKDVIFRVMIDGQALVSRVDDLGELMTEIALEARLDNQSRALQILGEMRDSFEQALVGRPTAFAHKRAQVGISKLGGYEELLAGISQLRFLREASKYSWEQIHAELLEVKYALINRDNIVVNITTEDHGVAGAKACVQKILSQLPLRKIVPVVHSSLVVTDSKEAIAVPVRVCYTAMAVRTPEVKNASVEVVMSFLSDTFLWNEIRVGGGAYGSTCGYDRDNHAAYFQSWDDPKPERSFGVYRSAGEFLTRSTIPNEEIKRSIIGTIGSVDQPLSPSARGVRARYLHLLELNATYRQERRDEILACSLEDFRAVGEVLLAASNERTAFVGAKEDAERVKGLGYTLIIP